MITRVATLLGLLLLCGISIARVARAPNVVPSSAPDTVFSAERAMRHVAQIAERPHPMGSVDHGRVRDYIVGQLIALGIPPQIQLATAVGTRYQEAGRIQNIVARLHGADPTAGRKALLLMAHYDGVGAGPAASDDAAGVAAILETLRAIRALNRPLGHDIIALFTDGEEAGLLGAAAFVREHPWAKDVAMVLNFEARGTTGRSVMFETGPGNLDAARALRAAGNVTAGSVYATVYRTLPNDTDLSELAVLGLPALNFAFADGVERYHTSRDDVADLNPGSVQHHGSQMLALAREIANGSLPRPRTGDGVFFDLPLAGLIVYPVGLELPLALLCAVVVAFLAVRQRQRVLIGLLAAAAAVVLSALAGAVAGSLAKGPAVWSGWYATADALVAIALTTACCAIARRWVPPLALRVGALVLWTILALAAALKAPGVAYLLEWPLLLAAIALFVKRGRNVADWLASAATLLILAGFIYGVSVVMLGLAGAGAIALAIVVSLVTLIVLPQIELVAGNASLLGAPWTLGIALVLMAVVALVVHPSASHPLRSALVYAEAADADDAWLGSLAGLTNGWLRQAIGTPAQAPAWTSRLSDGGRFAGHSVERVPLAQPAATLVGDTVIDGARHVVFRVTAPPAATDLTIRASGAKVLTAAIDGRVVDTTRYRYHSPDWRMDYWAVPDSGAIVALSIPVGSQIDVELTSRVPGLPPVPGVTIPARPPNVVPSQGGDMSLVYRRWRF
jgi:hypothetical protein